MGPIVPIRLPWALRSTFLFPDVSIYAPYAGWNGVPRFGLNFGLVINALPELADLIAEHHIQPRGEGRPLHTSSVIPPWVEDHLKPGELRRSWDACEVANVSRDHAFLYRDLVVHVQPYESEVRGYTEARSIRGLGLRGVEVREAHVPFHGTAAPGLDVPSMLAVQWAPLFKGVQDGA